MSRSKASSQPSMALSAEQLLRIHQAMRSGSEAEKVAARERFLAGFIGDDFDDEIDDESDADPTTAPVARQPPAGAEIAHSAAGALQNVTGRYKSAAARGRQTAQPAACLDEPKARFATSAVSRNACARQLGPTGLQTCAN